MRIPAVPQPGTESGQQGGDDSFFELMQTDEPNNFNQAILQVTVQVQINPPNGIWMAQLLIWHLQTQV